MSRRLSKQRRQTLLLEALEEEPLQTDAELAEQLGVSVQTIRLDRNELGLPEMRERARVLAERVHQIRSMLIDDVMGELLDLELGKRAKSVLKPDRSMGFRHRPIVRGHFLFAQANSLAVAVIDAATALTASARIRFLHPVHVGERIVAEAEVVGRAAHKSIIQVVSRVGGVPVFRGTFTVHAIEERSDSGKPNGAKGVPQ